MKDPILLQQPSSSTAASATTGGGGGRAIDRHNPIIRDEKRLGGHRGIFPFTSNITITSTTPPDNHQKKSPEADTGDRKNKNLVSSYEDDDEIKKVDDFIGLETSSRYLLSDNSTFNFSSELDHAPSPPRPPPSLSPSPPRAPPSPPLFEDFRFFSSDDDDSLSSSPPKPPPPPPPEPRKEPPYTAASKPPSPPPPPPPPSSEQVVVLEVSLHCRGCERKMKKHISKMEGVTSFKIEFAAKKVTVVGDVTPLAVLTSVLKVKNAKLLTPATISSTMDPNR